MRPRRSWVHSTCTTPPGWSGRSQRWACRTRSCSLAWPSGPRGCCLPARRPPAPGRTASTAAASPSATRRAARPSIGSPRARSAGCSGPTPRRTASRPCAHARARCCPRWAHGCCRSCQRSTTWRSRRWPPRSRLSTHRPSSARSSSPSSRARRGRGCAASALKRSRYSRAPSPRRACTTSCCSMRSPRRHADSLGGGLRALTSRSSCGRSRRCAPTRAALAASRTATSCCTRRTRRSLREWRARHARWTASASARPRSSSGRSAPRACLPRARSPAVCSPPS
mmetsp:Transcript_20743/g.49114  ORF Transcript_20743/g.49114 Transcript_20743/m.49114 type:complete len:283 (+) Transcript_20743:817-1665(+)